MLRRADCIEKFGYFGNIPTDDSGEPVINPITCQKVPLTKDSWSFKVQENDDYMFQDSVGEAQVSQCHETANALGVIATELSQKYKTSEDALGQNFPGMNFDLQCMYSSFMMGPGSVQSDCDNLIGLLNELIHMQASGMWRECEVTSPSTTQTSTQTTSATSSQTTTATSTVTTIAEARVELAVVVVGNIGVEDMSEAQMNGYKDLGHAMNELAGIEAPSVSSITVSTEQARRRRDETWTPIRHRRASYATTLTSVMVSGIDASMVSAAASSMKEQFKNTDLSTLVDIPGVTMEVGISTKVAVVAAPGEETSTPAPDMSWMDEAAKAENDGYLGKQILYILGTLNAFTVLIVTIYFIRRSTQDAEKKLEMHAAGLDKAKTKKLADPFATFAQLDHVFRKASKAVVKQHADEDKAGDDDDDDDSIFQPKMAPALFATSRRSQMGPSPDDAPSMPKTEDGDRNPFAEFDAPAGLSSPSRGEGNVFGATPGLSAPPRGSDNVFGATSGLTTPQRGGDNVFGATPGPSAPSRGNNAFPSPKEASVVGRANASDSDAGADTNVGSRASTPQNDEWREFGADHKKSREAANATVFPADSMSPPPYEQATADRPTTADRPSADTKSDADKVRPRSPPQLGGSSLKKSATAAPPPPAAGASLLSSTGPKPSPPPPGMMLQSTPSKIPPQAGKPASARSNAKLPAPPVTGMTLTSKATGPKPAPPPAGMQLSSKEMKARVPAKAAAPVMVSPSARIAAAITAPQQPTIPAAKPGPKSVAPPANIAAKPGPKPGPSGPKSPPARTSMPAMQRPSAAASTMARPSMAMHMKRPTGGSLAVPNRVKKSINTRIQSPGDLMKPGNAGKSPAKSQSFLPPK